MHRTRPTNAQARRRDAIQSPMLQGTDISGWRRVARWLLVIPVSAAALSLAYIGSQLLTLVTTDWVQFLDRSGLDLSIQGMLAFQAVLAIFLLCALWFLPTAFAVAFAAGWRWLSALASGLFTSLVLTGMYVWTTKPGSTNTVPHLAAGLADVLLVLGGALSLRKPRSPRPQLLTDGIAFGILLMPSLVAMASAPHELPAPPKLWAATLEKGTWEDVNTGSEFAATRQLAFARDRLVAVYESRSAPYQGKQPMAEYVLVSLDLQAGAVRNQRRFIGLWGATPSLYTASNGNPILADSSLTELKGYLPDAGPHFALSRGRVEQMSPDGTTMAWETTPGITLVDASALTPMGTHLDADVDTAVSQDAVLTDNISWPRAYPKDHSFVTLIDTQGEHLIFHGECAGRPSFLTNELILIGGVAVLDRQGHLVRKVDVPVNARFAGVSQNGKRFAVVVSESRGDPSVVLFEHFLLFDTETGRSLGMVRTEHMPANQTWSAFSPDGTLFASGDATALSLYQVP